LPGDLVLPLLGENDGLRRCCSCHSLLPIPSLGLGSRPGLVERADSLRQDWATVRASCYWWAPSIDVFYRSPNNHPWTSWWPGKPGGQSESACRRRGRGSYIGVHRSRGTRLRPFQSQPAKAAASRCNVVGKTTTVRRRQICGQNEKFPHHPSHDAGS
jgi:hypothetical protein